MSLLHVLMLYVLIKKKKNSKYVLNKRKSSNLLKGYESIRKLKNIEKKILIQCVKDQL